MKKYQDKIEQYLIGEMSDSERQAFEEDLAAEPDLRTAYEEELMARKVIRTAGRADLKARLESIDADPIPLRQHSPGRRWWLAAALIGLTLGLWWWMQARPSTGPQLFAQYFETYRPPNLNRGIPTAELADLERGLNYYSDKQFSEAIAALTKSVNQGEEPLYLGHFYLAQSYLAQNPPQATLALAALQAAATGEHFYRPVAQWYLALTHLQLGQRAEAKLLLEELSADEAFGKEEVLELLQALEN